MNKSKIFANMELVTNDKENNEPFGCGSCDYRRGNNCEHIFGDIREIEDFETVPEWCLLWYGDSDYDYDF